MTKDNLPGILQVNIAEEMKSSYLDYAMSVIVSRAIPDVRDGLKPVHRRILYAMYESGYHYNRQYRKSARIVGEVIGKYHPHGDAAVYDSLVRMAQDFSLRVMLVDGQGNFGSIDGDSPAAMRYTESRLAKISHSLLEDLDKETVDFLPNYDGSESEPKVLPARFPNLLVNGTGGIAVGMATNIPPHNLGEIIDACCFLIENPEATPLELMQFIKGPDFPTGASIMGFAGIKSAYETGKGIVLMRGKAHIEDAKSGKQSIIVTEIPYMVNKAKLIEKIAELVNEKRIEGITDIRDETDKTGIRVVIETRKDASAEVILNQIYQYSQLQNSFGITMLALDGGMPKVMNLAEVLTSFLRFREEVVTKRTIYLLNKARDRSHILVGLIIAVSNIDEIIRLIKSSTDPQDAKRKLMERSWNAHDIAPLIQLVDDKSSLTSEGECYLTEVQTKSILEMRLQRLTAMEKNKIEEDLMELKQQISDYLFILSSREKLLSIIRDELMEVREEFATPRLTSIEESDFDHDIEDLIQREDMVVTVTHSGYIKRVPLASYRAQKRGGKGRSGANMHEDDVITQIFIGSTHTPMLFFSNLGQVYSLKLYKLPLGNLQSKGRPMVNLLRLRDGEVITNIMPMPENDAEWDELNIMFATKLGNVRRNDLSDFKKVQANGKIAIRLDDGDTLVGVASCADRDHILLATKSGKAIRFPAEAVRVFKSRTSDGVRGVRLAKDDIVISMAVLKGTEFVYEEREEYLSIPVEKRMELAKKITPAEDLLKEFSLSLTPSKLEKFAEYEEFILTISENGIGKISSAYEYRITDRGGSGITNMNLNNKTGLVVASMPAKLEQEIMLITNSGKLIRCPLSTVRITGRGTSGVILFKTAQDEVVVSVSLIENCGDEVVELDDAEIIPN
ncbi:MAG: DNA topoisomerase (ATP-hydrolyzing) subunit A [Alphaproteobacteria bacterium]|nr:DNA topoisomerase (ATP-hydrolyzing) subunit A [Alphaproteobacteria bacterium]